MALLSSHLMVGFLNASASRVLPLQPNKGGVVRDQITNHSIASRDGTTQCTVGGNSNVVESRVLGAQINEGREVCE